MSSGAVRTHLRRKHGAPFVVALGQRGPHSSRWCPDLGSSVSAPQSQGRMLTCTSQSHVLKVAAASSRSSAAPYPEQTTEDGALPVVAPGGQGLSGLAGLGGRLLVSDGAER